MKQTTTSNELNRDISLRSILIFTLPSILMMIVMSLYTIVDGIFVSRLLGTNAFSAVNIVYPIMNIVIGLGMMFGTGTTAIVSRKLGEGKGEEANRILSFIMLFTVGLGFLFMLVTMQFLEPLMWGLGADEVIYGYCYDYAKMILYFLPFSLIQVQFQSLFVANGQPGKGLAITIFSGLTNVFLDYFFIAICDMGIGGAALATGIGYAISAGYGIYYFTRHQEAPLHFVWPKPEFRYLLHAVSNGSSEMVSNLSTSVTTFLFNIILMRLVGPDGVAAISILLYLDFLLIAVNLGYSIGTAPLFSYNYGSGDQERLKKLFRLSTRLCFGFGLVMTVCTMLFARPLSAIFSPEGSAVYELAVTGLGIYAFSYLFKGYNVFASALFTSFGNGAVSAILSFVRTFFLLIAAILLFSTFFGITGVWWATPAAEGIALLMALGFTIKFRKIYHYI